MDNMLNMIQRGRQLYAANGTGQEPAEVEVPAHIEGHTLIYRLEGDDPALRYMDHGLSVQMSLEALSNVSIQLLDIPRMECVTLMLPVRRRATTTGGRPQPDVRDSVTIGRQGVTWVHAEGRREDLHLGRSTVDRGSLIRFRIRERQTQTETAGERETERERVLDVILDSGTLCSIPIPVRHPPLFPRMSPPPSDRVSLSVSTHSFVSMLPLPIDRVQRLLQAVPILHDGEETAEAVEVSETEGRERETGKDGGSGSPPDPDAFRAVSITPEVAVAVAVVMCNSRSYTVSLRPVLDTIMSRVDEIMGVLFPLLGPPDMPRSLSMLSLSQMFLMSPMPPYVWSEEEEEEEGEGEGEGESDMDDADRAEMAEAVVDMRATLAEMFGLSPADMATVGMPTTVRPDAHMALRPPGEEAVGVSQEDRESVVEREEAESLAEESEGEVEMEGEREGETETETMDVDIAESATLSPLLSPPTPSPYASLTPIETAFALNTYQDLMHYHSSQVHMGAVLFGLADTSTLVSLTHSLNIALVGRHTHRRRGYPVQSGVMAQVARSLSYIAMNGTYRERHMFDQGSAETESTRVDRERQREREREADTDDGPKRDLTPHVPLDSVLDSQRERAAASATVSLLIRSIVYGEAQSRAAPTIPQAYGARGEDADADAESDRERESDIDRYLQAYDDVYVCEFGPIDQLVHSLYVSEVEDTAFAEWPQFSDVYYYALMAFPTSEYLARITISLLSHVLDGTAELTFTPVPEHFAHKMGQHCHAQREFILQGLLRPLSPSEDRDRSEYRLVRSLLLSSFGYTSQSLVLMAVISGLDLPVRVHTPEFQGLLTLPLAWSEAGQPYVNMVMRQLRPADTPAAPFCAICTDGDIDTVDTEGDVDMSPRGEGDEERERERDMPIDQEPLAKRQADSPQGEGEVNDSLYGSRQVNGRTMWTVDASLADTPTGRETRRHIDQESQRGLAWYSLCTLDTISDSALEVVTSVLPRPVASILERERVTYLLESEREKERKRRERRERLGVPRPTTQAEYVPTPSEREGEREPKDEDLCPVCLDHESDTVFMPCGHRGCLCCCRKHLNRQRQCFYCRSEVCGLKVALPPTPHTAMGRKGRGEGDSAMTDTPVSVEGDVPETEYVLFGRESVGDEGGNEEEEGEREEEGDDASVEDYETGSD
ncbi:hypothetical protein KIPB_001951 [Kipferlia bialata]|uniref:RING-type domain-containing protein n=1 Tax=Kipferlia bialata TaxID=797122 RepID=A0A9K3CPP8_9EUKA|nr:hypothetical protein KIPB_001951 [Kipferlia bialata]|eukprot:g1951.t1